jgi:glycine betaine catabolism B
MMPTFQKVANKRDLKEGGLMRVDADGKPIVLTMVKDKVYAMDAVCSHEGGPLEDGTLDGYDLKCPWHYAVFDVRNAKVSEQTVWATDLQSYPVKVDEATGDIMISSQTKPASEATLQENRNEAKNSETSQKKYYEEDERKANKLSLELISKVKLQETDIMTFRLSRVGMDFAAGQYAFFKLDGVSGDPKGPTRHFSIASSPTEQDLLISTRIRDTPYKQQLASLEVGTEIPAWGPQGEFVLHDDHSKPAVLLSGGIGVTPFRSMVKYATDKHLALKIVMFDSNRNESNILYKDEFDRWAKDNKNLKVVQTLTDENVGSWNRERGRINKQMITKYLGNDEIGRAIFYICGPPGMLNAMQKLLSEELRVPDDRIMIEEFTGY